MAAGMIPQIYSSSFQWRHIAATYKSSTYNTNIYNVKPPSYKLVYKPQQL